MDKAKSFWADTRAEWEDTRSGSEDSKPAARAPDRPGPGAQPPGVLANALVAAISDPRDPTSTARQKFLAMSIADRMIVLKFLRSLQSP